MTAFSGSSIPNGWRALPPALAAISCGCFLPDLTRFTGLQCGEARRNRSGIIRNYKAFIAGLRFGARGFSGVPGSRYDGEEKQGAIMGRFASRGGARLRALPGL